MLVPRILKAIWSGNADNPIMDVAKLILYWLHHLQNFPLICLHRLAHRRVLPKAILTVPKLPLCTAFVFAIVHRRRWRTKSKSNRSMRKPQHNTPCDHIVSHQSNLIPQSTGIHINENFGKSVLYDD